jgi:Cobaltochelatase CobS subunit N terminal.
VFADVFNIDSKLTVKGFAKKTPGVPKIDSSYVF